MKINKKSINYWVNSASQQEETSFYKHLVPENFIREGWSGGTPVSYLGGFITLSMSWFNNLSIWQLKISFRSKLNSILTCNFNYLGIMKQLTSFFIQYGPRLLFLWEGRSGGAPEDLCFFPTFVLINFHDFKTSNQIKNEPGFRYLCISPISYT